MEPGNRSSSKIERTILLAEDEQCVRELLCRLLEQHGFMVLPAKDGKDALEIASKHANHIDLLVADVHMPKMGGVDLAKQLRQTRPDLPILLMSGDLDTKPQADWTFLEKPFHPNSIVAKVKEAVDKSLTPGVISETNDVHRAIR